MVVFCLMQGLGVALGLLYVFFVASHAKLPRWRSVLCAVSACALSALLFLVFQVFFPETYEGRNGLIAIALFHVFLSLCSGFFRLPNSQMPELASPMLLIWLVFDRIGCQCIGRCASSLPVDWGFYSEAAQKKLLPLQLAEAATAILVATFLILRVFRKEKKRQENHISWILFLVGAAQFVAAFFRGLPAVAFGLSEAMLWALFLMAEGFFWRAAKIAFGYVHEIIKS